MVHFFSGFLPTYCTHSTSCDSFYDSEPLCLLFSPSLLGYLFLTFKIPDYRFLEITPPNEARLSVPPLGSHGALYLATI